MNLRRRHLDESQRGMVAPRLATMRQGERGRHADLYMAWAIEWGTKRELHVRILLQAEPWGIFEVKQILL